MQIIVTIWNLISHSKVNSRLSMFYPASK